MKYYLYISDTKIDMLYPQVPHAIKTKMATEFKVDVKVVSASRKTESESEENRIVRLETVANYIKESGKLGNVDEPREYVGGYLRMKSGAYGYGDFNVGEREVVYYGGKTENTVVGLGGSARNLIGNGQLATEKGYAHSHSATSALLVYLSKELNLEISTEASRWYSERGLRLEEAALIAVSLATQQMVGPEEDVEFVAKRLAFGSAKNYEPDKMVLLATPLYIAMKN